MMVFGLLLKSKSASMVEMMIRYWEMRSEINKLTGDAAAVLHDDAMVRFDIGKHDVESTKAALEKLDKDAKEAFIAVHKLVQNDFISLQVLTSIILKAEQFLHLEVAAEREVPKGRILDIRTIKAQLSSLERAESEIGNLSAAQILDLLHRARAAANGTEHLIDGKMDSALFVKEKFFANNRWIDRFVMRYEAASLRRAIRRSSSTEESLDAHSKRIQGYLKGKGSSRQEAKEFSVEEKDIRKFIAALKDAFIDVYKLFVKSMLKFVLMIRAIKREEIDEKQWVANFEIPSSLYEVDKKMKDKLLGYARQTLRDVNYDINQLDALASQIRKAAAA